MAKKLTEQERLAHSVQKYITENDKSLKKHKLMSRVVVVFPNGKTLVICKIAMWILRKYGARFDTQFARIK